MFGVPVRAACGSSVSSAGAALLGSKSHIVRRPPTIEMARVGRFASTVARCQKSEALPRGQASRVVSLKLEPVLEKRQVRHMTRRPHGSTFATIVVTSPAASASANAVGKPPTWS
jgi:hypothetical protein